MFKLNLILWDGYTLDWKSRDLVFTGFSIQRLRFINNVYFFAIVGFWCLKMIVWSLYCPWGYVFYRCPEIEVFRNTAKIGCPEVEISLHYYYHYINIIFLIILNFFLNYIIMIAWISCKKNSRQFRRKNIFLNKKNRFMLGGRCPCVPDTF